MTTQHVQIFETGIEIIINKDPYFPDCEPDYVGEFYGYEDGYKIVEYNDLECTPWDEYIQNIMHKNALVILSIYDIKII